MPLQQNISQTPRVAQPTAMGSETAQLASQQLSSLSQRLQEFSGAMLQMEAENTKVKAADNAIADMGKYREKTNEILSNTKLTKTEANKQLQDLQEGQEYDGWGQIYKNSYKNTFDAAYANTVTTDAVAAANLAEANSMGSSQAFAKMWGEYSNGIVRAAPTDALAATAKLSLAKQGSNKYKSLATAEYTKDFTLRKKSSEDTLEYLKTEYTTAYANYDKASMDLIQSQYVHALKSAVDSKFMTEDQAGVNLKIAVEDATASRYYTDFTRSINENGNTAGIMKDMIGSKEYQQLPEEKRATLMKNMFADMKAKDSRKIAKRKESEYWDAEQKDQNYREAYALAIDSRHIEGGLNNHDISRMVVEDEITPAQGDALKTVLANGGRKDSDGRRLATYYKDYALTETTSDDIMNDYLLSDNDKIDLFKKQQQLKKTKYKWTTSQNGKEARDRVKRLFGIQEGTFMAQMDMNNENGRAFDSMYTKLFDEVSALPQEEQEAKSIEIANRLINGYNQTLQSEADNKKVRVEKKRLEATQKKKDEYDKSIYYQWDSLIGEPKDLDWFIKEGKR